MPTTIDTIRTVFEAQFTGQNAVRAFVRQMDLAKKVTDSLFGSRGSMKQSAGAMSDFNKVLDAQRISQYQQGLKRLSAAYMDGRISIENANSAASMWADKMGMSADASAEAAKGVGFFSTGLGTATIAAGAAAAGIAAVTTALIKLYPVAKEGAGLAQLEMSFDRLNRTTMHTPGLLNDMRDAANGTISSFGAMEAYMTLAAGATGENARLLAESAPRLMEIAKAANVLNPLLGDTTFMFNSLARGIKRSEQRLVDNLGLVVRFGEANKRYAESVGKSVSALSAEEKQIAALNEVLRVGGQLVDQVGGDVDSLADPYLRLGAAAEEAGGQLKIALADMYPVGGVEGLAKMIGEIADETHRKNIIAQAEVDLTEAQYRGFLRLAAAQDWSADEMKEYLGIFERSEASFRAYQAGLGAVAQKEAELAAQRRGFTWEDMTGTLLPEPEGPDWFYYDNIADKTNTIFGTSIPNMIGNSIRAWDDLVAKQKEERDGLEKTADAYDDLAAAAKDHNREVLEAYQERIAATGDALMAMGGEGNGFYTRDIEDLGDAWAVLGGRTEAQNELLSDFEDAMGRSQDVVRDYSTGLKGFGMEQDKINEKIGEASAEVEFYKGKIEELKEIQGTPAKTQIVAEWDMDKLEEYLIAANDEAGKGVWLLGEMKMLAGDWTEEQKNAAIAAAAVQIGMDNIAGSAMGANEQFEALAGLTERVEETMGRISQIDIMKEQVEGQGLELPEFDEDDPMGMVRAETKFNESAGNMKENWFTQVDEMRDDLVNTLFPGTGDMPEIIEYPVDWEQGDIEAMRAAIDGLPTTHYVDIVVNGVPNNADPKEWNIPERAVGGPVSARQPYLVGERGPEIFWPSSQGNIIPNDKLGGGSTYNFYISNPDAKKVKRAIVDYIRYTESR